MKGKIKIDDQTLVLREHGIQVYIFHVWKSHALKTFYFFWKSYTSGVEDEQGRSTAHDKMGMLYSVHNNIMAVTCNLGASQ